MGYFNMNCKHLFPEYTESNDEIQARNSILTGKEALAPIVVGIFLYAAV